MRTGATSQAHCYDVPLKRAQGLRAAIVTLTLSAPPPRPRGCSEAELVPRLGMQIGLGSQQARPKKVRLNELC